MQQEHIYLCNKSRCWPMLVPIILVLFFTMGYSQKCTAYSPPIGIPDPGYWGSIHPIDSLPPSQPLEWPNSQAPGFYYVDDTDPRATDTGNTYGYPDRPRVTIPASLNPGEKVFVAHCSSNTTLKNVRGDQSRITWIIGTEGATIKPESTGTFLQLVNCSYFIVTGITFDGAQAPNTSATAAWSVRSGSDHVCVRNCTVKNMPAPPYNPNRFQSGGAGAWYHGLTSISPSNGDVDHVIIFNCNISDNAGGQTLDYESGRHCIISSGDPDGYRVEYVWILNCTFRNNPEDGIQLGRSAANSDNTLCRYFYIGNNTISSNGENAIDLKACTKIIISQNEMSGYKRTSYREGAVSGSDGTACVINDDGGGPGETWWLFNKIHDSRCAWRNQASGGKHYLIGNIIYNLKKAPGDNEPTSTGRNAGVAYWQSAGNSSAYLINNTLYNVHGGFYMNNVSEAVVEGNIVCDLVDHTAGWPININNSDSLSLGNNIYYDPDGSVRQDSNAIDSTDLVNVDPKLKSPSSLDLRLKSDSPAIGRADEAPQYAFFTNEYGINIKFDHAGTARPQGDGWDIGAFEFVPSMSPASPSNLHIVNE